ncbi:MAG: gas vesicle protein GvpH [Desulfomonilaceae bacterium]|nr:gas vesicle protein GvpH [Desulfomonilaceae bacterium]
MSRKNKRKTEDKGSEGGVAGFLGNLTEIVERLGELAEKTKEISGEGNLSDLGLGKQLKGVYGFNVKVGLGEDRIKVQPFGNIKRDRQSGETIVQEVREPMVDVFEEDDHLRIVAEMPGIGPDDVTLEIKDDVLTIRAEQGEKKYEKEVLLPRSYSREKVEFSCNNGMLDIKCFE